MNDQEYRKIELAKIIKAIRDSGFAGEQQLEEIQQSLLVPADSELSIRQAIEGLSEEDEFALMCRLMGTATHLVPLEQRPVIQGEYIVPDFLARFQPGCAAYGFSQGDSSGFRCFVEVKSTNKRKFKISGSRLRRLRSFADQFGLPLIFSVRFLEFRQNALWVIVEDADRTKTSMTVEVTDWISGIRHVLWDEYFYFLSPGLHFRVVFDKASDELGIGHSSYGTSRQFQIIDGDEITSFDGGQAIGYSAFFEAFHLREAGVQKQGDITYQTLVPELVVCSLADMVYNLNRLPIDESGNPVLDASKTIAQLESPLFNRRLVTQIAQTLMNQGFLHILGIGDKETHLKKWCEYGGSCT